MTGTQVFITIAVVVAATMLTRFLPYICFPQGRKTPKYVNYLGKVLAPAVFGLLVVNCLRNVNFTGGSFGIPEIIAVLVVIITFVWKRQMLLSMASGTLLYMLLVQTVFK